jgi:hypothetical protein
VNNGGTQRLVIWLTGSILGFQALTLVFDLVSCTALSFSYMQHHGQEPRVAPIDDPERAPAAICRDPHTRTDNAVKQALSMVAGLAMGGAMGFGTASTAAKKEPPTSEDEEGEKEED